MSDYGSLLTPRFIGIVSLTTIGLIVSGLLLIRGIRAWGRYCTGWNALTKRFPATGAHKFGGRYQRQTGFFGTSRNSSDGGGFTLELAQEGLVVTADFDRTPLLIPWPAIRDVEEASLFGWTRLLITVDYESRLRFTLPQEALREIQGNVPPERFHQSDFWKKLIKNLGQS
jgi:hypothetical protein